MAFARLRRVERFMAKIAVPRSHGVNTWKGFCAFSAALFTATAETSVPGLRKGSGYTQRWLARSFAFAASSECLGVEKITTEQLAEICPDAKGWLHLWPRMPVKEAMKQAKYTGPALLFTMNLCLVGSKSMNFDIKWLERHANDIDKRHKDVEAEIGMGPTPASICTGILKQGLGVAVT